MARFGLIIESIFIRGAKMQPRIFLIAVVSLLTSQASLSADELKIQWKLVQPFRFFRSEIDYRLHLAAAQNSTRTPSDIEVHINNYSNLATWYQQNKDEYNLQYEEANREHLDFRKADNQKLRARQGWASTIWEDGTCWDRERQRHTACMELGKASLVPPDLKQSPNPYVLPVGHLVEANIKGPSVTGDCKWEADQKLFQSTPVTSGAPTWTASITRKCTDPVRVFIPWSRVENAGSALIHVSTPAGDASQTLSVRDILVVGMGDSFASGEGNPDEPARLSGWPGFPHAYIPLKAEADWSSEATFPRRDAGDWDTRPAAAKWNDRKCHRSLYSAQLRSALQIALADPNQHTAVTFMGFACSGAEVSEGILFRYGGKEDIDPGNLTNGIADSEAPQIDKAIRELCETRAKLTNFDLGATKVRAPYNEKIPGYTGALRSKLSLLNCEKFLRKPDLVLLSAGGNDIGFAPLIANVTMSPDAEEALFIDVRKFMQKDCNIPAKRGTNCLLHGVPIADRRLKELPARYMALRKAILQRLAPAGGDAAVIFTSYPHAYHDASGKLCGDGNAGMTIAPWFETNKGELKKVCNFAGRLYGEMKTSASAFGWTFVDAHRPKFVGHGYCASRNDSSIAEQMGVPFRCAQPNESQSMCKKFFVERGKLPSQDWQLFNPSKQLLAYASRQRWFRTYNDAYLMVNYWRKGQPSFPSDGPTSLPQADFMDLAQLSLGGPIHPTAEALSHVADAIAAASINTLKLSFANVNGVPWEMDALARSIDTSACSD